MDRETIWDDMNSVLMQDMEPEQTDTPFEIHDLKTASWASRVLARLDAEADEIKTWMKEELAEVKRTGTEQIEKIERKGEFLRGHLFVFLNRRIKSGEMTKKSIDLGGGRIGVRKAPDSMVIEDEDKVIAALEKAGVNEPIKIEKKVLKTGLSEVTEKAPGGRLRLKATGELLEGVFIEPGGDTFSFSPRKGD